MADSQLVSTALSFQPHNQSDSPAPEPFALRDPGVQTCRHKEESWREAVAQEEAWLAWRMHQRAVVVQLLLRQSRDRAAD
jgi:hypothetical protein